MIQLPKKYHNYNLIKTIDGVSKSAYLLGDKYVLKLYANDYNIEAEKFLLGTLDRLKIARIVEYFYINGILYIIYDQVKGESIFSPTNIHIKQIAIFLKNLHNLTRDKTSTNKMIFSKTHLQDMIKLSKNKELEKYFDKIDINLKNDGIIHGDLFCDNAKFLNDSLSGVYDFSESCNGDFIFDLAVVAIAWCFDNDKLNKKNLDILLDSYETNITKKQFLEYMKYALLYYSTLRIIDKRDSNELLKRLENI